MFFRCFNTLAYHFKHPFNALKCYTPEHVKCLRVNGFELLLFLYVKKELLLTLLMLTFMYDIKHDLISNKIFCCYCMSGEKKMVHWCHMRSSWLKSCMILNYSFVSLQIGATSPKVLWPVYIDGSTSQISYSNYD